VEITLFGKGVEVMKRTQAFAKDDTVVLGGPAPNSTAWLVFLKRIEDRTNAPPSVPKTATANAPRPVQGQTAAPKPAQTNNPGAVPKAAPKS
jgi:hypothetical protein